MHVSLIYSLNQIFAGHTETPYNPLLGITVLNLNLREEKRREEKSTDQYWT